MYFLEAPKRISSQLFTLKFTSTRKPVLQSLVVKVSGAINFADRFHFGKASTA